MKQSDKKTLDSNIGLVITKKFNRLSYKEKKVLLRLPERLWNRVWMQSRKNNRSINGEIITVLDDNTRK